MPLMTAQERERWKQVVRDCREVDAEEDPVLPLDELRIQIVRQPDRHETLVALISAVREYANESCAATGRVVNLLDDALGSCNDVYMPDRSTE